MVGDFGQVVPHYALCDYFRFRLFTVLGQTRGLFAGIKDWPDLNECLREPSAGQPEVLSKIASGPGGFVKQATNGDAWAFRLAPLGIGGEGVWACFGIHVLVEDQEASAASEERPLLSTAQRLNLEALAGRLWFFERAEQVLWWVYWAVLHQRRSVVYLPDVLLARALAGSEPLGKTWRKHLMDVFRSLTTLYTGTLCVTPETGKPQLTLSGPCLRSAQDLHRNTHEGDCQQGCPLFGLNAAPKHGHIRIEVGEGFLGLLEAYRREEDGQGVRTYDFKRRVSPEAAKLLQEARRAHQLVSVYLPAQLTGSARLSGPASGILQALVRELTRDAAKPAARHDKALVIHGNQVPDANGTATQCPLLDPQGQYVTFGGNGNRSGRGYRLVGAKGLGWLVRCGEQVPDKPRKRTVAIRRFVNALGEMDEPLGLVVAALDHVNGSWLTLAEVRALANHALERSSDGRAARQQLERLHLRIYTAADYLDRWKRYFLDALCLLSGQENTLLNDHGKALSRLQDALKQPGWTQRALAQHLEVSQPFLSQILTGKRPLPENLAVRVESLLEDLETSKNDQNRDAMTVIEVGQEAGGLSC